MTKEELLEQKKQIKKQLWDLEQTLKDKVYVSSVDFQSMYPSVIRLLNVSIESLVGFLEDDPIAYRELGLSNTVKSAKALSKEMVRTSLKDSKYVKFVGKKEDKISLRCDIYAGKYADKSIEEITETPFERYFLASIGLFDADKITMKFQGKMYTITELNAYFKKMDYSVSGAGSVFKRSMGKEGELGLIPSYLAFLFAERKNVKNQMSQFYKHKILLTKFKMACEADGIYS